MYANIYVRKKMKTFIDVRLNDAVQQSLCQTPKTNHLLHDCFEYTDSKNVHIFITVC